MTCRARRESFFWLRARQFFLSCLFSFSSFLSSPPTLSSSVPWFVSSLQSSAACLANRQSPIDNPGYPVFSLPTFSLSNRTKKVRAPVQSPPKSQVFGPPLGIFSPFASPRLASLLPIASGWSVTCLPHFSPTELPRLKTKPQRSPLTRPFFFPRPFLPSPSARLTSHPTGTDNPLPIGSFSSSFVEPQCTAHSVETRSANALDVGSCPSHWILVISGVI